MALARCKECGIHHERTKQPVSGKEYKPPHYPDSGLLCGKAGCENPALIRLTFEEENMYQKGKRVFEFASAAAKVRVV